MSRRAHVLMVSIVASAALGACNRSEELGHLPDGAAQVGDDAHVPQVGDDAHVDSGCGASSTCSAPNGTACTVAAECASGFCVGGVCCNTACTGSAMACYVAGSVGTCTASGSSAAQANGTVCKQASDCVSGFCVGGVCCNTACTGSSMACDVTGSVGTCTASGSSAAQANGTACKQASDCVSGFCAGYVCCNAACAGSCMTCSAIGSVGTCMPTATCP